MKKRPLTGLRYKDRVAIAHPDLLPHKATGYYVGYSGGETAMVVLDGTSKSVQVPRVWIEREETV